MKNGKRSRPWIIVFVVFFFYVGSYCGVRGYGMLSGWEVFVNHKSSPVEKTLRRLADMVYSPLILIDQKWTSREINFSKSISKAFEKNRFHVGKTADF